MSLDRAIRTTGQRTNGRLRHTPDDMYTATGRRALRVRNGIQIRHSHNRKAGGPQGQAILRATCVPLPGGKGRSLMARFLTTVLLCFLLHLALTAGTGDLGIWNKGELLTGAVLSLLVGALAGPALPHGWPQVLNPRRWGLFLLYLFGPFFWAMAKANVDVVYRVITGRIKPGIVRISPKLSNDVSTTLLANSITLTPGTLSVEVDQKSNDLFIHWIYVDESVLGKTPRDYRGICGSFPQWARRIAG